VTRARAWIALAAGGAIAAAVLLGGRAAVELSAPPAAAAPGAAPAEAPPAALSAPAAAELADDVALLAIGAPATAADRAAIAARGGTAAAFGSYIDELLRRPGAAAVAGNVLRIIGSPNRALWAETILRQQGTGADAIYYIHEPCAPERAVRVRPWWDLGSTVRVCPEAYRPDVFRAPDGNYCSGVYAAPFQRGSPCGCGPNLLRCLRGAEDKDALSKAIVAESAETIAWVVSQDLPIQTLFSSPESFRRPHAELLYQRWRVENRDVPSLEQLADWRKWPAAGAWAPRPASKPGQHAGILTNHFTPQAVDSQRLKVSGFLDTLWCEDQSSQRVATHALLEVAEEFGPNLRSKVGWEALAARPVCTSCHARIDYGVQFFTGMEWYFRGLHYMAGLQQDREGPLYHSGIDDERGRAKRNPQGFAQLALAQPEFPRCMARNFLVHAFGGPAEPELRGLEAALRAIVARKGTYRELMRATLARYVERRLAREAAPARPRPPEPASTAARAAQVVALVDDHCGSCHGPTGTDPPDRLLAHGADFCARAGADCGRLGVAILSAVVLDQMPKEQPLAAAEKRRLFELLAPLIWPDARARASAQRYFIDALQAPPVHRLDAMLSWVRSAGPASAVAAPAGAGSGGGSAAVAPPGAGPGPGAPPAIAFPGVFSGTALTISAAAQLGIAAAKVCAGAADPRACLARALAPRSLEK
jgi:hypothetical protein